MNEFHQRMKRDTGNARWKDGVREMNKALEREGISGSVLEIFSPTRVNGMAGRLGIVPGMSLDLTTVDPDDGRPWDFNNPAKRAKAMDMVIGKKALLLIGSPMCKAFSRLQHMNINRMDPKKWDRMISEGKTHLRWCMALYQMQMDNGMYFLHEHPWSAKSWDDASVRELMDREGVETVKGDMCCFGMFQEKNGKHMFVKKPTGFMTNASEIARELEKTCDGDTHTYIW